MKIRTKAPNFALTKELNENTNKSTKFWLKVWQNWALAREYDVDTFWQNFQTSLVLLIPNCTRHRMITYTYILSKISQIYEQKWIFILKTFQNTETSINKLCKFAHKFGKFY